MNLYRFNYNNPEKYVDFNGLWPTGSFGSHNVHGDSILRVLPFLPPSDLKILVAEQVIAVKDQSAAGSFKHAMSDGKNNQSVNEAMDLANQFVLHALKVARCLEKEGRHEEALQALGDAMHALQDSTSPEHNGFKPWDGHPNSWSALLHGLGENFYPGAGSNLDAATKDAYDYFTGAIQMPKNFFKYSADPAPLPPAVPPIYGSD